MNYLILEYVAYIHVLDMYPRVYLYSQNNLTKMRKIRPRKHTVRSAEHVTALQVSGHMGAMVCPWLLMDRALSSSQVLTRCVILPRVFVLLYFFASLSFLSLMLALSFSALFTTCLALDLWTFPSRASRGLLSWHHACPQARRSGLQFSP